MREFASRVYDVSAYTARAAGGVGPYNKVGRISYPPVSLAADRPHRQGARVAVEGHSDARETRTVPSSARGLRRMSGHENNPFVTETGSVTPLLPGEDTVGCKERDPSAALRFAQDDNASRCAGSRGRRLLQRNKGQLGDLIRRFAPPVRLAVPEKPFGLTLILRFFDRCGKRALALSATGSAKALFPVRREGLREGKATPLRRGARKWPFCSDAVSGNPPLAGEAWGTEGRHLIRHSARGGSPNATHTLRCPENTSGLR